MGGSKRVQLRDEPSSEAGRDCRRTASLGNDTEAETEAKEDSRRSGVGSRSFKAMSSMKKNLLRWEVSGNFKK